MGVYDNTLRDLVGGEARAVAEWLLGASLAEEDVRFGPTELPGSTLRTDTVIEVGSRCLHVEYQYRSAPSDIEPRLVAYWSRLRQAYGNAPEQHVVVLNPSGGRLTGAYESGGLRLAYTAHHLWDVPAATLLRSDVLFPLAVLGATDDRPDVVARALHRAVHHHDPRVAQRLVSSTLTLANVHLGARTLEELLRRIPMPIDLRELPMIQDALAEGRAQGREEGREEGAHDALVVVAVARFGELPNAVREALRSSTRPLAELSAVIVQSSSADELRRALGLA